jgi:hypothetical protein
MVPGEGKDFKDLRLEVIENLWGEMATDGCDKCQEEDCENCTLIDDRYITKDYELLATYKNGIISTEKENGRDAELLNYLYGFVGISIYTGYEPKVYFKEFENIYDIGEPEFFRRNFNTPNECIRFISYMFLTLSRVLPKRVGQKSIGSVFEKNSRLVTGLLTLISWRACIHFDPTMDELGGLSTMIDSPQALPIEDNKLLSLSTDESIFFTLSKFESIAPASDTGELGVLDSVMVGDLILQGIRFVGVDSSGNQTEYFIAESVDGGYLAEQIGWTILEADPIERFLVFAGRFAHVACNLHGKVVIQRSNIHTRNYIPFLYLGSMEGSLLSISDNHDIISFRDKDSLKVKLDDLSKRRLSKILKHIEILNKRLKNAVHQKMSPQSPDVNLHDECVNLNLEYDRTVKNIENLLTNEIDLALLAVCEKNIETSRESLASDINNEFSLPESSFASYAQVTPHQLVQLFDFDIDATINGFLVEEKPTTKLALVKPSI